MKNYAIVGFIYTQACPLSCNFCCHTKEVVGTGKFTPEAIVPLIVSFASQPSVTRFAFSGGDAFLFIDDIIEAMSKARTAGVTQPFHIVTSGYWAKNLDDTKAILTRLFAIGMDALDVSYDTEHSRFVPPENIYRIGECCEEIGLRLEIFGHFWNPNERVEDLLPKIKGAESIYSGLVMPIGAARVHFKGRRYNTPDEEKYSCGKPSIYDVAIYPNGETYPCCSGGFNKEAGLACGNVYTDSAADILSNVFRHFHVRIAKEIGFDRLYSKISLVRPDLLEHLPQFSRVDSVCEICRDLHTNVKLMQELSSIYEILETEYVLEAVEKDWNKIHSSVVS